MDLREFRLEISGIQLLCKISHLVRVGGVTCSQSVLIMRVYVYFSEKARLNCAIKCVVVVCLLSGNITTM